MKQVASDEMVKNAVGEDEFEKLSEPPHVEYSADEPLWPAIKKALQDIYDPEIPVNIYSLGLIYCVEVVDGKEDAEDAADVRDVYVRMTLTSPACPVAQEMPVWVQNAIFAIEGVGQVEVEIVWDPAWDPSYMSETAKLELNMF